MSGSVKEATGISGAEFYSETQGELPKDERQFKIEQISNMLYQFDDLTDVMIKATGAFRSLISSTDISIRELYQSKTQNLPRRVTFCGSSNHMELIRDKTENRYMPFLQKGSVDVELFNSIDKFQFWAQIRGSDNKGTGWGILQTLKTFFLLISKPRVLFINLR